MGRWAGSIFRVPNLVVCMRKESDHVHRMRAEADAFEEMDWVSVRDVDRMAAGCTGRR